MFRRSVLQGLLALRHHPAKECGGGLGRFVYSDWMNRSTYLSAGRLKKRILGNENDEPETVIREGSARIEEGVFAGGKAIGWVVRCETSYRKKKFRAGLLVKV